MELHDSEYNTLVRLLLDVGEGMLCCGAEVKRVENTLTLMAIAYGAVSTDIFVITSGIVVTIKFQDEYEVTQTRRIVKPGGTNLQRLDRLNTLSRRCCKEPMPLEELRRQVELSAEPVLRLWFIAGSILAAGSFSVFFGGTVFDGIAAGVFALLICLMQLKVSPLCPNNIIFNLICAFVAGVGICLLSKLLPTFNADKIMIGDIMLLIPGIAITNSLRDMLVGDTISGTMRAVESLLWAVGIAVGFMLAIWITGGAV